jgi:hypothetical protein
MFCRLAVNLQLCYVKALFYERSQGICLNGRRPPAKRFTLHGWCRKFSEMTLDGKMIHNFKTVSIIKQDFYKPPRYKAKPLRLWPQGCNTDKHTRYYNSFPQVQSNNC